MLSKDELKAALNQVRPMVMRHNMIMPVIY
jgi:hypothetical protein